MRVATPQPSVVPGRHPRSTPISSRTCLSPHLTLTLRTPRILVHATPDRPTRPPKQAPTTSSNGSRPPNDTKVATPTPTTWGIFQADRYYRDPLAAPWELTTTGGGLFAWLAAFLVTGLVVSPLVGQVMYGADFRSIPPSSQAIYALVSQILEVGAGLGTIYYVTKDYEVADYGLFRFSLGSPFEKDRGWLVWALLGIMVAPFFVGGSAAVSYLSGWESYTAGGKGTVDAVSQMVEMDGQTFASLFTVTAILAPLLEETVFRGFLLTGLCKVMDPRAAVVVSAGAFGVCHFSAHDLPQLIALGIVLGFTYLRSRNLATPMLIHGMWNGVVLSVLFALVQAGVDISTLTG